MAGMNFRDVGPVQQDREPGFEEIATALKASALKVCEHLLPGGQRRGDEYV